MPSARNRGMISSLEVWKNFATSDWNSTKSVENRVESLGRRGNDPTVWSPTSTGGGHHGVYPQGRPQKLRFRGAYPQGFPQFNKGIDPKKPPSVGAFRGYDRRDVLSGPCPLRDTCLQTMGGIGRCPGKSWCRGPDSNWGHRPFQGRALPPELPRHDWRGRPDLNRRSLE